jgi:hypothetical protein
MNIGNFRIPYCPKCTAPNKKKRGFTTDKETQKIYQRWGKDKKKITTEVWQGKQTEIVRSFKPKGRFIPNQYNENGTPNDAYIRHRRKIEGGL